MKFKATDEQVAQIAANAATHAKPVGMGFLHFKPGAIPPETFKDQVKKGYVDLDYVDGRMTKLYIAKKGDVWSCHDGTPDPEYQSWCHKYPTYADLVKSVGAEIQ